MPYLDIPSNEVEDENEEAKISVPNLKNKTYAEAKEILETAGLTYKCQGSADEIITEQVPKAGAQLTSGGIVKLYVEGKDERVAQNVPDLKGVSYSQAKIMLETKSLNISSTGKGIVIAQDQIAGTSVDEGTIVSVTLQEAATGTQN